MRFLSTILFLLLAKCAIATNYYVSNAGNDAAPGSKPLPKQTLAGIQAIMATINAGDSILLRRGDVFVGGVTVSKGVSIDVYSSGSNPVITGFNTVGAWTYLGGNIWESAAAISTLTTCNMVTISGARGIMARYPNTGYIAIASHTRKMSITSPAINNIFANGELVIKINNTLINRSPVWSVSGTTVFFDSTKLTGTPIDGYGFFGQNNPSYLDVQNEWYFDSSTKKIQVYSLTAPVNVKVAAVDKLITINAQNITIKNIDFEGANTDGIFNSNTLMNGINISKCSFSNMGYSGLRYKAGNGIIDSCGFFECNSYGLAISNGNNATVKNCSVKNIGLLPGASIENIGYASGIFAGGIGGKTTITGNTIMNIGLNGINFGSFDSSYIAFNRIDSCCLRSDDGAGIYGGKNAIIEKNIITNCKGLTNGIADGINSAVGSDGQGVLIYIDDNGDNDTIRSNIGNRAGIAGIYLHNASNCKVYNNTIYDAASVFYIKTNGLPRGRGKGNEIKNNVFVAAGVTQRAMKAVSEWSNIDSFGVWDNNIYSRPLKNDTTIAYSPSNVNQNIPLTTWKNLYFGPDAGSTSGAVTLTTLAGVEFKYNTSSLPVLYSYPGQKKKDITAAQYINYAIIPGNSGVLLFDDGTGDTSNMLMLNGYIFK